MPAGLWPEVLARHPMADIAALEGILKDLQKIPGVSDAVLVSRSGMHIAGEVPEGAHGETFVAMFAILLGAAETATSELREKLDSVVIELEASKILVLTNGPKAIFVLRTARDADVNRVRSEVSRATRRVEEYL
ncbi:MAG: roadblock/LC7 domain-containing protein [Euryarchaeota archaeon]|nr:roadblock/LC7 domain-containing protein [Euryarchaeota archaeon]